MPRQIFSKNGRGGSININSFLISLATVGGLIIGLGLNQFARSKGIAPVDLVSTVKPAEALPDTAAQTEAAPKAVPEKIKTPDPAENFSKTLDAARSIQRLKDYIKDREEKGAFLKEKVELLNDLLNSKGRELARLNTDNAILKENLNKAIELQDKLKADFQAGIDTLNAQLSKEAADISSLNAAKSSLENQVAELNNKLSPLSTDYTTLQGKFTTLEQDKAGLEARLSKIKEDLDRQEAINEALNKNVSELTLNLAAKEKEHSDIGREMEQLNTARANLESELGQLRAAKAGDEDNIKQLNSRINELNVLYEEAKKSLFQLPNLLAAKEQLLAEKQNEISGLKDSVNKTEGERNLRLASLGEKEKVISELNLTLASMESRLAVLQRELSVERERQARLAQQLSEAVSLNQNLKNKLKNIYLELELIRTERSAAD
jgi:DNA repair exonuclease SbcCD ATPase subunit